MAPEWVQTTSWDLWWHFIVRRATCCRVTLPWRVSWATARDQNGTELNPAVKVRDNVLGITKDLCWATNNGTPVDCHAFLLFVIPKELNIWWIYNLVDKMWTTEAILRAISSHIFTVSSANSISALGYYARCTADGQSTYPFHSP